MTDDKPVAPASRPNEDLPTVSIVMPAYNAVGTIDAAIRSVIEQTWPNWELLIVVDAATDDTLKVAQRWADRDTRIQVFPSKVNGGVATSRNLALEQARGEYLAFLDSDDLWLSHKLAAQVEYMQSSQTDVCYATYERFNEQGPLNVVIPPEHTTYSQLLRGNVIGNLTGMAHRRVAYGLHFKSIGHEDYLYWLCAVKAAGVARRLPDCKPVARYRVQPTSLSANKLRGLHWQWSIYRRELKLPWLKSGYLMLHYVIKAIVKRREGA